MKNLKYSFIGSITFFCIYLILTYINFSFLPNYNDLKVIWEKLPKWYQISYKIIMSLAIVILFIILVYKKYLNLNLNNTTKIDIELKFIAKEPNKCSFGLKGSQDDLIKAFTAIYKLPQGKEFVGRILEASQVAYFNNEQVN